jgi:protein-tyrosine-phosphatase
LGRESKQQRGRGARVYGYSQGVDEKEEVRWRTQETAKNQGCQMKTKRKQNVGQEEAKEAGTNKRKIST